MELNHVRHFIPGDHLQLEYRFWLFYDALRGNTPLFHNLYEFNTGDDSQTYRIHPQYLPFSACYALLNYIGGRSFAWNTTLFLSMLLTFLFSVLLYKKIHAHSFYAYIYSILILCIPYRFHTLLGGSPTGLAMTWIPLFYLGLYIWFKENKHKGALISGIALLCSYTTDMHVFYFSALSAPFIALLYYLSALSTIQTPYGIKFEIGRKCKQILMFSVWLVPALYFILLKKTEMSNSFHMNGGRMLAEIALFTPFANALVQLIHNQAPIYLGYAFILFMIFFCSVVCVRMIWNPSIQSVFLYLFPIFYIASLLLIYSLSLGEHGIFEGRIFLNAREWIPEYDNIRQPLKVLCLSPTLFLLFFAHAMPHVNGTAKHFKAVILLATVLSIFNFKYSVKPTVTTLPSEISAYSAIAHDARLESSAPRAVAIPIWPGDTHWSSLYEYAASLYHVRMINGYSPTVKAGYVAEIFNPLKSLNSGIVSEEALRTLRSRNIQYVILHENAFPEKGSPFPVGFTKYNLMHSPYLDVLHPEGPYFAFKIKSLKHKAETISGLQNHTFPFLFSARKFYAENLKHNGSLISGQDRVKSYIVLHEGKGKIQTPSKTLLFPPSVHWKILARGNFTAEFMMQNTTQKNLGSQSFTLNDWTWIEIPTPPDLEPKKIKFETNILKGEAHIALIMLEGENFTSATLSSFSIPSEFLFHAGYSNTQNGRVTFTPESDADSKVLYAPLALKKGVYTLTCHYHSEHPTLSPGEVTVSTRQKKLGATHLDSKTDQAHLNFTLPRDDLVNLEFHYSRLSKVTVQSFTLNILEQ